MKQKDFTVFLLMVIVMVVYLVTGMKYWWQALTAEALIIIGGYVRIRRKAKVIEMIRTYNNGSNVSNWEVHYLQQGKCPDCDDHAHLYEGPSGGMTTNYLCPCCGSKFNLGYQNGIDYGARISHSSRHHSFVLEPALQGILDDYKLTHK